MKKKILILNTGGTISSVHTEQGYAPAPAHVEQILANNSMLAHSELPHFDLLEYEPLIDSSNMTIAVWNRLAADIVKNYAAYDGFIIFHGTDTMAYTASALSFMLENLGKPVVLTGSQIPLTAVRSDAIDNIQASLWLCAHHPIPEVCVLFEQKLFRGNRVQKVSEQQFSAFDSPNYPPLATFAIQPQFNDAYILPASNEALQCQFLTPQTITNFRLFPGMTIDILAHLLKQPLRALVLATFGSGNAPNDNPAFLDLLHAATQRGMVIVNCTQCHHGAARMNRYATGYTLNQAGLISGQDMTIEATHCKLLYLLSKYDDNETVKAAMQLNLRGELTVL